MDKNVDADNKTVEPVNVQKIWPRALFWVVFIWLSLGATAYVQTLVEPGPFGDMFGVANSLFAGLAFAGIILSLLLQNNQLELQREELRLQRLELRDTRGVLEGQQKEMALQAATLKRQAADANFFRMLEMFRAMAQNMRHPGGTPQADYHVVQSQYNLQISLDAKVERVFGVEYWRLLAKVCQYEMRAGDISLMEQHWGHIYRRWDTSLAPYFATFSELLVLIAEAGELEGKRWAQILRAQFGLQEMLPIYFHGLSPIGRQRLKSHIEKFGIFAHFSNDPEYHKIAPQHCYEASAFSPQGAT